MIRFPQDPCSFFLTSHFFLHFPLPPVPPQLILSCSLSSLFLFPEICYTTGKSRFFLLLITISPTTNTVITYKIGLILFFERSNKSQIYIFYPLYPDIFTQLLVISPPLTSCHLIPCT